MKKGPGPFSRIAAAKKVPGTFSTSGRLLAAGLVLAGSAAAVAHLLELRTLFPDAPLPAVSLAGGLAAALAGAVLWAALHAAGLHRPLWRSEAARITGAAGAVALGACIAAALGGFLVMKHATQEMLLASLAQDFQDRATLIRNEVGERFTAGEMLATRPNVQRLLAAAHDPRGEAEARVGLQQVAASFLPFDLIALSFLGPDGRLLAHGGAPDSAPAMRLALPGRGGSYVAWNAGFELEQRVQVRVAGRPVGTIALRQPLREMTPTVPGGTPIAAHMVLGFCAAAGAELRCLPGPGLPEGRVRPLAEATPQIARALAGETGVLRGPDHRGVEAFAAFGPLAELGLAMVVRIPAREVLAPLRAPLAALPFVVAGLAALVTVFVFASIAPLARRLDQREQQLRLALDSSALALWEWRLKGDEVFVSEHWQAMRGGAARPMKTRHADLLQLVHPQDLPAVRLAQRATLKGEIPRYDLEHRVRALDGSWIWIRSMGEVVERDAAGRALRCIGTNTLITERKQRELAAVHAATHDALTGLPNRSLFDDRLAQALGQARRHGRTAGALLVDLDKFKDVNDTLGHAAGDALLKEVAARLARAVRASDTAARVGGDEFAVVLPELARGEDATAVAGKILAAMAAPIRLEGVARTVTVSIGAALFPRDGAHAAAVLAAADAALYRAKREGRDRVIEASHG